MIVPRQSSAYLGGTTQYDAFFGEFNELGSVETLVFDNVQSLHVRESRIEITPSPPHTTQARIWLIWRWRGCNKVPSGGWDVARWWHTHRCRAVVHGWLWYKTLWDNRANCKNTALLMVGMGRRRSGRLGFCFVYDNPACYNKKACSASGSVILTPSSPGGFNICCMGGV